MATHRKDAVVRGKTVSLYDLHAQYMQSDSKTREWFCEIQPITSYLWDNEGRPCFCLVQTAKMLAGDWLCTGSTFAHSSRKFRDHLRLMDKHSQEQLNRFGRA
jgi:hypothetical protein